MSDTPSLQNLLGQLPKRVRVADGREVELRLATPADEDAVLAFSRALPEGDLLFLRVDITRPEAVRNWLANVAAGVTVSLLAFDGERLVGYVTVDRNPARWTRRVGEIRVNVCPEFRSLGLGRQLTAKIFDIAQALGLRKIMAHMTPDQLGAQAAFKRLGFVPEALLADYVEDRRGRSHDLVIMSHDLEGFTDHADQALRL
ncbi:MAG: GNAT family N-acetyltransferase [Pseudomonadales bacterium]